MAERPRHLLIGIPGIDDSPRLQLRLRRNMERQFGTHGFAVYTYAVGWHDASQTVEEKFERLVEQLPRIQRRYERISAYGPSAGGLAAVAGLLYLPEITKAVAVAAPLQLDAQPLSQSLRMRKLPTIPVFEEWMKERLGDKDHSEQILTLSVASGDDINPIPVSQLARATNYVSAFESEGHISALVHLTHTPDVTETVVNFLRAA